MVRLMRRSGERFDVRINASRLVDGDGRHIGWMGSLHDVTEIRREREALQASHERFVAVLNGLDAAVAVSDAETGELLMSNLQFDRAFQLPDLRGRCCILPFVTRRAEPPVDAEWYDGFRDRWYQIKSRQSTWVDGSAVWLEIATDATALKSASERERQQNEALQQTARLISMGEMASSLAHELNQPLGRLPVMCRVAATCCPVPRQIWANWARRWTRWASRPNAPATSFVASANLCSGAHRGASVAISIPCWIRCSACWATKSCDAWWMCPFCKAKACRRYLPMRSCWSRSCST